MQVLVMSDTHGDADVINKVRGFYPNADIAIHCGDSELAYDALPLKGMQRVRGNCDADAAFMNEVIMDIDNTRIFATHGHLFNVKSSMLSLAYRATEVGANLVCFGHSHRLGAEMIEDVLFLNPGSLKKPRGRLEKSFALIEIQNDFYQVTFLTDDNNPISSHTFTR